MDIGGKARKLERRISRTIDAAVVEFVGRSAASPLEVVHGVLDRAESEIQDLGRGRRVFPFNHVRVHIAAGSGDREARARFTAMLDGPPSLSDRVLERLKSCGCAIEALRVAVAFVRRPGTDWTNGDFHVEFDRADAVETPPLPEARVNGTGIRLKLSALKGVTEQRSYAFTTGRIDIGRQSAVVDQRQRLIRTNHVAFKEDGADENRTVSRRHAHIEFSESDRSYRLWDDRSAHGTLIVRHGRTIKVPAGARGTRLESDDEIVLGQAKLRVVLEKRT